MPNTRWKKLLVALLLLLFVTSLAGIGAYGWWFRKHDAPFFAFVQNLVTMVITLTGLSAGITALFQLWNLGKTRDFTLATLLLNRYIEDPRLFTIRGFISMHMSAVNCMLAAPDRGGSDNYYILQEKVLSLSRRTINYNHLLYFVMCMNHASFLMSRLPFSYDLRQEFHPHIKRHWELLESLIKYERERRGGDAKEYYARHFEDLYKEIICQTKKKQ